mgnify:CR=1 FL=1
MKQIIKHFSEAMIVTLVGTLMFGIIFSIRDENGNIGFVKMTGQAVQYQEFDYNAFVDFDKVFAESQKAMPVTMYDLSQPDIVAGQDVVLSDYIHSTAYNGSALQPKVKKILKNGIEVTNIYDKNSGIVNFPKSGVYDFYISVMDDTMRRVNLKLEIPVSR